MTALEKGYLHKSVRNWLSNSRQFFRTLCVIYEMEYQPFCANLAVNLRQICATPPSRTPPSRISVRKIRAPIKIKSAPPPPPKNHPPKKGNLRTWFFLQKERIFPGVHKIGAPISGPRIADTNFTDTRIFLILINLGKIHAKTFHGILFSVMAFFGTLKERLKRG